MGASNSAQSGQQAAQGAPQGGCPVKHDAGKTAEEPQGGCPVKHDAPAAPAAAAPAGGCPVKHGEGKPGQQYNVYAQPIDPTNQMPFNPNQLPAPGQTKALSTDRVKSFIPKGGTEAETWQYPSPQMFYNALMRKGKGDDVDVDEVETIVAVHNNMNERAWNLVVNWERALHGDEFAKSNGVRLSRFMGRPDDISPMAWFKSTFMGYPKPFDRHDWVVDRAGKEVRYVIDFYYDDDKSAQDEKPALHDVRSIKSISMDARPAVDSLESVIDRIKYPVLERLGKLPVVDLPDNAGGIKVGQKQAPGEAAAKQAEPTSFENVSPERLGELGASIGTRCSSCFETMNTCSTESDCQRASVALTHCMASLVCPPEAEAYAANVTSEPAFDGMVACMGRFEKAALDLRAKRTAAATAQN